MLNGWTTGGTNLEGFFLQNYNCSERNASFFGAINNWQNVALFSSFIMSTIESQKASMKAIPYMQKKSFLLSVFHAESALRQRTFNSDRVRGAHKENSSFRRRPGPYHISYTISTTANMQGPHCCCCIFACSLALAKT